MKRKRIGIIIGTVCAFALVLYQGTRSSVTSNNLSGLIATPVYHFLTDVLGMNIEERLCHAIIRKSAHVVEYGILALFFSQLLCYWVKKRYFLHLWLPIVACFCIALLDEYLQAFCQRTSSMKDVWFDVGGSVLFIVLNLVLKCFHRRGSEV